MKRELVVTADGSHSISIPDLGVSYHSKHGAVQESKHVFIEAGLRPLLEKGAISELNIFEVGFGTGLNALLSLATLSDTDPSIHYTAIEPFPLQEGTYSSLNYCKQIGRLDLEDAFQAMHRLPWEQRGAITNKMDLLKLTDGLLTMPLVERGVTPADVIYFDAFAPSAQPELWSADAFRRMFDLLSPGGLLVTYCSKSVVRRAMQEAGLLVEKLQGPWGKREMLRARRPA